MRTDASATAAVWIGADTDGSRRATAQHKERLRVPPLPFLRERLRAQGGTAGTDFDTRSLAELCRRQCEVVNAWDHWNVRHPSGGVTVVALARVSNAGCAMFGGPLTEWTQESMLQFHMYGMPSDSYDCRVEDVRQVAQPTCLEMRKYWRSGAWEACKINRSCPLFTGVWREDAGGVGIADAAGPMKSKFIIFYIYL